jgi:phosphoglucomutase
MNELIQQNITKWLEGNIDETAKETIRTLQVEDPTALADAFYRNLEFGTGGLRGIMGIGTNRINKYTIGTVFGFIAQINFSLIPVGINIIYFI